ncbi:MULTISPECIES: hypothetical protein [Actinoplanes]|uniref:hypothetical protein n=1 Tax=Actinoplanes TaxID=1865 RepID=UPI0005F2E4ED|nr:MULTISPECIES: hypothetical protein [Actinoplanes]
MREQVTVRIGVAMAAGAIVAGCATTGPGSSASPAPSAVAPSSSGLSPASPPSPSTVLPSEPSPSTIQPSGAGTAKPPREPTDNLPTTGWVAGMVTQGGKGPCYGLIADDGTRYALYATDGTELVKGDRVRVQLATTMIRIYCGPGILMAMTDSATIQ